MQSVKLRKVRTTVGEGFFLGERISGSGWDVADILMGGAIRCFLAETVRVNGHHEEMPRGSRTLYRSYLRAQRPELPEPPQTPPDPYDLDPVRKMDGED